MNTDYRLKIVYQRLNYDAFIAAFVYWYFAGDKATLVQDICQYDGVKLPYILPMRARNNVSIGTLLTRMGGQVYDTATFTSFENSPLLHSRIAKARGADISSDFDEMVMLSKAYREDPLTAELREYFVFEEGKPLTQLVIETLVRDGHVDVKGSDFTKLNQYFGFYQPTLSDPFQHAIATKERVMTLYPTLAPRDMPDLAERVRKLNDDDSGFMPSFLKSLLRREHTDPLTWR